MLHWRLAPFIQTPLEDFNYTVALEGSYRMCLKRLLRVDWNVNSIQCFKKKKKVKSNCVFKTRSWYCIAFCLVGNKFERGWNIGPWLT